MSSNAKPVLTKEPSSELMVIAPPINPNSNAAPSGCWEVFKRSICCCFSSAQQQQPVNAQFEPLTSEYMIESYGELIAKAAQLLVHVDLNSHSLISLEQSQKLNDTAQFIQTHIGELKRMVQHVRYYYDALQYRAGQHEDHGIVDADLNEQLPANFDAAQTDVVKRSGKVEKFAEHKLIKGLQEAPLQPPLTELQIDEIVTRIKQQIAIQQAANINTGFIRNIVNQECFRIGAHIAKPAFLDQINSAAVVEHLQQVDGFSDLTSEDFAALVQTLPDYVEAKETIDLLDG